MNIKRIGLIGGGFTGNSGNLGSNIHIGTGDPNLDVSDGSIFIGTNVYIEHGFDTRNIFNGEGGSIEIVNDLTTGGADKALSAEMGKELDKSVSKKVFTDNGYVNKVIKELYIIDPDRTEEDVYTLKYLRRNYIYNSQWALYIYKNGDNFISKSTKISPENDIVFQNTDPTYKFFAVIDWQQLEVGVESITQDTTITKDAFFIGNCPMISSVFLENNLNILDQKVDDNDDNIKKTINDMKEEITPKFTDKLSKSITMFTSIEDLFLLSSFLASTIEGTHTLTS